MTPRPPGADGDPQAENDAPAAATHDGEVREGESPSSAKKGSGPRFWKPPLITGLFVALVTVVLPFTQQSARGDARTVAAIVVAGALLNGLVLPRLEGSGRQILITGYLTACAVAWSLGRNALAGHRLDPWLGACGSLGWALFAMTWARRAPSVPSDGGTPSNDKLQPRGALPRTSVVVGGAGIAAAMGLALIPWWVADRNRAMVAHGVALVGAAFVVSISFRVASDLATPSLAERAFGRSARRGARALAHARGPLALALLVALAGLAYWVRPGLATGLDPLH